MLPKSLAVKLLPRWSKLGRAALFFLIEGTLASGAELINLLALLESADCTALAGLAFWGDAGVSVKMGPMLPVDARTGLAGRTGTGEEEAEEAEERVSRPEPMEAERRSMGEGENLVLFCSVVERLYCQYMQSYRLPFRHFRQAQPFPSREQGPDFKRPFCGHIAGTISSGDVPHSPPDMPIRASRHLQPHRRRSTPFLLLILILHLIQKVHTVHPPQTRPRFIPLLSTPPFDLFVHDQPMRLARHLDAGEVDVFTGGLPRVRPAAI